jgi:Glycosyltransferase family 87
VIATRPANSPATRSESEQAPTQIVRLLLLACAGVLMQVGWTMVWTLSYRLTHGNDFTYVYLVSQSGVWEKLHDLLVLANTLAPGLEGPQGPETLDIVVNSLVFAFVVTGVGYLCAILLIDLGISAVRGALLIVVVFEVVFQLTLFLTPGLFTTDIFSYVMYGHISAIYNLNPYIYPPNYFPGNPLLEWIHPIWHDQPSVYGPLWTDIGWIMARLVAPFDGVVQHQPDGQVLQTGLMDQVFAYKLLMNGVQVINLALVWWLLGRIMADKPRARLAAFVVFAWNPLMLFDAAGNAHNDALMVTLLLLGVVPLVARPRQPTNVRWLLSTFFVGLSALIKYTTGLVGLFLIVPWARRLTTWPRRLMWLGGAGALVIAVTVILFIPWLDFPRALEPILVAASGKSWMYSNWAPDLVALTISDQFLDPNGLNPDVSRELVRPWAKLIARGIFGVYLIWELVRLWRIAGDRSASLIEPILTASVRAFIVMILVYFTWVLEWYWMWPLALATLLGWRRMLTKVVVGYTLTSLPIFYVHHYWSTHMPGVLVLAYALPPLALPLLAWAYERWIRRSDATLSVAPVFGRSGLGAASE